MLRLANYVNLMQLNAEATFVFYSNQALEI